VLQELVQELNESPRSNQKWLEPTVNVLLAFSETLGEAVGSVWFRTQTCPRFTLSYLFDRYSHLQRRSSSVLVSFSQCVPFLSLLCGPS
jgi:hypothetical protein